MPETIIGLEIGTNLIKAVEIKKPYQRQIHMA